MRTLVAIVVTLLVGCAGEPPVILVGLDEGDPRLGIATLSSGVAVAVVDPSHAMRLAIKRVGAGEVQLAPEGESTVQVRWGPALRAGQAHLRVELEQSVVRLEEHSADGVSVAHVLGAESALASFYEHHVTLALHADGTWEATLVVSTLDSSNTLRRPEHVERTRGGPL